MSKHTPGAIRAIEIIFSRIWPEWRQATNVDEIRWFQRRKEEFATIIDQETAAERMDKLGVTGITRAALAETESGEKEG